MGNTNDKLESLKQEAKELGIEFSPNIGVAKLQEKVDSFYAAQESSGEELQKLVAKVEKETAELEKDEPKVIGKKGKTNMVELAQKLYTEAKKLVVVTIIDNDQRVNNQTTTVSVNWSNAYYDLGTKSIPLNVPVEIEQGYVNVLKEVLIPHHVKDSKTGLSTTVMRARYSIS